MKRILLTGARAPATLHLARLLAEQGALVYVADSCRFPITRTSNAIQRFFELPAPVQDPAAFQKHLFDIIQANEIDWLIPTCEEAFHVSLALEQLQNYCQVLTDTPAKLVRFHNKWQFSQLIDDPDIRSPETHLIDSKNTLKHWQDKSKDYVFKPVYSRFASKALIRPTKSKLSTVNVSTQNPWIAQKFIVGQEYSSYSVAHAGKISIHCAYHSPYRAGQGAGIYFKPLQIEAIEQFVARFAKQHHYTGQLAFDFIEDTNGQLLVLECNPRLTSGIHLYVPQDKIRAALLNENPSESRIVQPTSDTFPMLGSMMWLYGLSQNNLTTFLQDLRHGQDVIATAADSRPAYCQPFSVAEVMLRSLKHRCSLLAATTIDIEWNGHERHH